MANDDKSLRGEITLPKLGNYIIVLYCTGERMTELLDSTKIEQTSYFTADFYN